MELPCDPATSQLGIYPKHVQSTAQSYLRCHVHCSIIRSLQRGSSRNVLWWMAGKDDLTCTRGELLSLTVRASATMTAGVDTEDIMPAKSNRFSFLITETLVK